MPQSPTGAPSEGQVLISPKQVAQAVHDAIRECATNLRPDFLAAVKAALEEAQNECANGTAANADARIRARQASVLGDIVRNAQIGHDERLPICQDTGSVWVCLEVGQDVLVPGNVFSLVPDAVARAYTDGALRMSMLNDALLDRTNTNTNNPAFCEVKTVPGGGCTLHVMLKGGGSDNASRLVMLAPGEGREGVKRVVLDAVREKAANACPPLVIGVGVGATFDKVAGLSKHALLRPMGSPAASEAHAAFERELLDAVNATGIGPAALGGGWTALAVHVETAACHIAALPVAVNMGCCAMRSASVRLA